MSNKKEVVVIDKETFKDIMYYLKMADADISFKHTEIQIDQSIEERADGYAEGKSSSDVFKAAHIKDFIEGATSQQIIESMKRKEKFIFDKNDPLLKEKTTVLMEGTFYPNDGFYINGVKVFPDTYLTK